MRIALKLLALLVLTAAAQGAIEVARLWPTPAGRPCGDGTSVDATAVLRSIERQRPYCSPLSRWLADDLLGR